MIRGIVNVASYDAVTPYDTDQILAALVVSPVSAAVNSQSDEFAYYTSGVLTSENCGLNTDHAVLIVGHGLDTDTGLQYFYVKNSWGETWGDEGYLRIGVADGPGICGINTFPYTVSI